MVLVLVREVLMVSVLYILLLLKILVRGYPVHVDIYERKERKRSLMIVINFPLDGS